MSDPQSTPATSRPETRQPGSAPTDQPGRGLPNPPQERSYLTYFIIICVIIVVCVVIYFLLRRRSVPSETEEYLKKMFTNKFTGEFDFQKFANESERLIQKATKRAKPLVEKANKIEEKLHQTYRESRKAVREVQRKNDQLLKILERQNMNRKRQQQRRPVRE